jgi:hypothetical protein
VFQIRLSIIAHKNVFEYGLEHRRISQGTVVIMATKTGPLLICTTGLVEDHGLRCRGVVLIKLTSSNTPPLGSTEPYGKTDSIANNLWHDMCSPRLKASFCVTSQLMS